MKLHNNHFCLIWKSERVYFNQAIKELKENLKMVDIYKTDENVNSLFEYKYTLEKVESHLSNFIVYDLETHNTDRARPYKIFFHRLSKLAGKNNRDLTTYEMEKWKKRFYCV